MGALTAKQIFYEWFSIFKTGQQLAQWNNIMENPMM
jgi:hypothetical protein